MQILHRLSAPMLLAAALTNLTAAIPLGRWGTLANPGFIGQPMKSVYFFAGDWRAPAPGEPFYDGIIPTSNVFQYTIHPLDAKHLGWSEDASYREFAVNSMLAAGVNVVNMSYWGPPGTDRWAFWAPMQTATGAHDQLFDAAVGKPILIAPYIEESPGTSHSAPYLFGDDFPGTQANPAPQLVAQIVDLVNRYLCHPANPAWPGSWAQMFDQNGIPRYVISIIHVGSNNLPPSGSGPAWDPEQPDRTFAGAFAWVANQVYEQTHVLVGFTLDTLPAEHAVPFKPTPQHTAYWLLQQPSVLAVQMFVPEVYTVICPPPPGTANCDAAAGSPALDRLVSWKRSLIFSWVTTNIPVILDVSPGYDARIVFPPALRYGNNRSWRDNQTAMLSLGVRGLTANTWNGYTEGYAIVPSCGFPPGLLCSASDSSDDAYQWFRGLIPPGGTPARQPSALGGLGPSIAMTGQSVPFTARLTDALTTTPLPGRTLFFQLGSQVASAVTDANGIATASFTINQPASIEPLQVSFAGDSIYLSITQSESLTVTDCPVVTSITPAIGRDAGNAALTIYGSGLDQSTGPLTVNFGNNPGNNLWCDSLGATCTVLTPPGTGTVPVTVTRNSCPSAPNPPAQYTYRPTPVVLSISPNHGPQTGNTLVTVLGRNLDTAPGATSFNFGLATANNPQCREIMSGMTLCTVSSPAYSWEDQNGTNPVHVVSTVDGLLNSIPTAADEFLYDGKINPPPCKGTSCQ